MEFDIEVSPYQKLHAKNEMIIVDTQPASILARPFQAVWLTDRLFSTQPHQAR